VRSVYYRDRAADAARRIRPIGLKRIGMGNSGGRRGSKSGTVVCGLHWRDSGKRWKAIAWSLGIRDPDGLHGFTSTVDPPLRLVLGDGENELMDGDSCY
jgi:hypothetical protein